MEKIYRFLYISVALLAFAPIVGAQTPTTINDACKDPKTGAAPDFPNDDGTYTIGSNVGYKKVISKPQSDGTYWIKLEAFATGSAAIIESSIPADVVLVLDLSSSMKDPYNGTTRLGALKTACIEFLEDLYENAVKAAAAGPYAGNRVAIVTYSGGPTSARPAPTYDFIENVTDGFVDITEGVTKAADGTYSGSLITAVNNFNLDNHSGTRPDQALEMVVNDIAPDRREGANFSVLVFTDGYPVQSVTGSGEPYLGEGTAYGQGSTRFTCQFANDAIYYANQLKGMGATVFSVGLITEVPAGNTLAYQNYRRVLYQMELISSNYKSVTTYLGNGSAWNIGGNGAINIDGLTPGEENTDGKDYFQLVDENTDLSAIFKTFSEMSGGTPVKLNSASSTVDIVSSSFKVPTGTNSRGIKLFTARCTNAQTDPFTFEREYIKGESPNYSYNEDGTLSTVKVDANLGVNLNGNVIEVTGFEYSNNWCGTVKNSSGAVIGSRGYKVIILIPVNMNPDAVGGPNVETNAPGSGIYENYDPTDPNNKPLVEFDPPTVSLPVNVYIEKVGLEGRESAKFRIDVAYLPASGDPEDVDEEDWEYVSTVFVTNSPNSEHRGQNPMVRVKGMPATRMLNGVQKPLIYRITEEGWSWSYTPDETTYEHVQYTVTSKVDNPFTFENDKRTSENIDVKVRHAESKSTNIFTGTGVVKYDDSKENTGRKSSGPAGLTTGGSN